MNDLSLIVRAHQLVQEGYLYWFNDQLVTVWSAPNYCYRMNNKAALLHLDENSNRHFIIFETVPESSQSKNYRTLMPYFLWFTVSFSHFFWYNLLLKSTVRLRIWTILHLAATIIAIYEEIHNFNQILLLRNNRLTKI